MRLIQKCIAQTCNCQGVNCMNERIGRRLFEERDRLKLTQQEMAEAAGVQKRAYNYYEKGERYPDAAALEKLSKRGIDVYYVISGLRQSEVIDTAAKLSAANAVDMVVDAINQLDLQGKLSLDEIKTLVGFVLMHKPDQATLLQFVQDAVSVFRPALIEPRRGAKDER